MPFTYPAPDDAPQAVVNLCDVRLLVTDIDSAKPMLQDAEITSFLRLGQGYVFLAAALALEYIANKTTLVLKRIETLELKTDGPATAKDLRAQAATYRVLHEKQLEDAQVEDEDDEMFDFAEMAVDTFSAREIYHNTRLRGL